MKKPARVLNVRPAGENDRGDDHQVVTFASKGGGYCKRPCATCPWRVDAVGEFPAEAFRHSAPTAYDAAFNLFSCHSTGLKNPSTCAGFILRGATHNIGARLKYSMGEIGDDVTDGGHELFPSYRAMAVANGVDPEDPILQPCRD